MEKVSRRLSRPVSWFAAVDHQRPGSIFIWRGESGEIASGSSSFLIEHLGLKLLANDSCSMEEVLRNDGLLGGFRNLCSLLTGAGGSFP